MLPTCFASLLKRVDPKAKNLKVYAGYMFAQRPFDRIQLGVGRMNSIDVPKLIEHLERKSTGGRGHREALEIMEKMLRVYSGRRMLKQAAGTEIDQLMQYIEGWKELTDSRERVRTKMVIDSLEALK